MDMSVICIDKKPEQMFSEHLEPLPVRFSDM